MQDLPLLGATNHVFVGGHWRDGARGETLPLHNPSDGSLLAHIARGDAADIDAAVAAAQAALDGDWGRLTAAERGRVLLKLSPAGAGTPPTNWRGSRRWMSASR